MAQPDSDLPIDIQLSCSSTYPLFCQLFSVSPLRDFLCGQKHFLPFQRREKAVVAQVGGWVEDEGPGQSGFRLLQHLISNSCSAFEWAWPKLQQLFAGNQAAQTSEPSLLSGRSDWFQMIKSCPGKSNGYVCLFLPSFNVSDDSINGSLVCGLLVCKNERERERESSRTLRLVRFNKVHEVKVSRSFHLCSWALECTNTTCDLQDDCVRGSCGSFMLR